LPIIAGILAATLANHAAAGGVGAWLANTLDPRWLNWIVVASFAVMAVWVLIPDRLDERDAVASKTAMGIFATTVVTFFLAEMGDKTQIVTVALAARFHDFIGVVAGTTTGMMLANIPVVFLGHRFADRLPTKAIHIVAAILFVILGAISLRNALTAASI
jgi:putative Ca2+/H+ antiporter (TMEM165/GDT1 family)